MLKIKKIVININKKENVFDLSKGIIALKGDANIGKSSFISLIYLLLGSKTTLSSGNSFEIFKNTKTFNIKDGDFFELHLSTNNDEYTHKAVVVTNYGQRELEFYINNNKESINSVKNNYKSLSNNLMINSFVDSNSTSITSYNLDAYFRTFQKVGKMFSPPPNTKQINNVIESFMFKGHGGVDEIQKKQALYFEKNKLDEIIFSYNKNNKELETIKKELKLLKKTSDYSNNKEISTISIKMSKLSTKIVAAKDIMSNLKNESDKTSASTLDKYYKLINKIDFKDDEVEGIFREYLFSLFKGSIAIRRDKAQFEKELKNMQDEYNGYENIMREESAKLTLWSKVQYLENRIMYLEKASDKDLFLLAKDDILSIQTQLEDLNSKTGRGVMKDAFIARANELYKMWNGISDVYDDVDNSFKLFRTSHSKASTTLDLADKIIAFIICLENIENNLSKEELMPSVISINSIALDMNAKDIKEFSKVMVEFQKIANKFAKYGTLFIVQDKHDQLGEAYVESYDFNSINPFNKK